MRLARQISAEGRTCPLAWLQISNFEFRVFPMSEESILVFSTFPDADTARHVGRILVEEKLAACVNVLPEVESIYRWKGAVETASEVLTLMKSTTWKYELLEARIRELHPYEVPEIVSIRINAGHTDYLRWIEQSVI
jgi:periplasmic divalent cation tolerance protein